PQPGTTDTQFPPAKTLTRPTGCSSVGQPASMQRPGSFAPSCQEPMASPQGRPPISALARSPEPLDPPATRTLPPGRRVAVWQQRALPMLPPGAQLPEAGP